MDFKVNNYIENKKNNSLVYKIIDINNEHQFIVVIHLKSIDLDYQCIKFDDLDDYQVIEKLDTINFVKGGEQVLWWLGYLNMHDVKEWCMGTLLYYDKTRKRAILNAGNVSIGSFLPYNFETKLLFGKPDRCPDFYNFWKE